MEPTTQGSAQRNPHQAEHRTEQIRHLRRLLTRHSAELSARRFGLRAVYADGPNGTDAVPTGSVRESRDVGPLMASMSSRTVQLIENALNRLQAGTYGTCADCGGPITSARLRALPFADSCRDCQEGRDIATGGRQLRS